MVSNTQIHTSSARAPCRNTNVRLEQEKSKISLKQLFYIRNSESTPKNDGSMSKKKKNKPQEPARRASHWPNLGQFEHENNYNKNHNLLNKVGIHEY